MNKFTKEFKEKGIKLKEKGIHPNNIFKDNGYNIKGKQKDYTSKLINRWKKRMPQSEKRNQKKKIKYLELKINSEPESFPK